jgi:hypothetical protein
LQITFHGVPSPMKFPPTRFHRSLVDLDAYELRDQVTCLSIRSKYGYDDAGQDLVDYILREYGLEASQPAQATPGADATTQSFAEDAGPLPSKAVTANERPIITVALSRHDAYHHLFVLCQNDNGFSISDYHKDYREGDYDRIVIGWIEWIEQQQGEASGAMVGTVRLLPVGNKTAIMFVDKDALHHVPIRAGALNCFQNIFNGCRSILPG